MLSLTCTWPRGSPPTQPRWMALAGEFESTRLIQYGICLRSEVPGYILSSGTSPGHILWRVYASWPCPPGCKTDAAGHHLPRQLHPKTRSCGEWGFHSDLKSLADSRHVPLARAGSHFQPESHHWQRGESRLRLTPTVYTAPHPEHSLDSVGRKMVGVDIQLETNPAARPCWDFCFFSFIHF